MKNLIKDTGELKNGDLITQSGKNKSGVYANGYLVYNNCMIELINSYNKKEIQEEPTIEKVQRYIYEKTVYNKTEKKYQDIYILDTIYQKGEKNWEE